MAGSLSDLLSLPLSAYARARSLHYSLQTAMLYPLKYVDPVIRDYVDSFTPELRKEIDRELFALLDQDVRNIRDGLYPVSVLQPESPVRHFRRFPKLVWNASVAHVRRSQGRTAVFDRAARKFLDGLPRYYRRNFHFQTDGYLSEASAELYEHQVDILFRGSSDSMRRLIIAPLKARFPENPDGEGLRFLEVACGTGRATRFVRLAFPKAKITAVDLSEPYLKYARRALEPFWGIDFVQAAGEALPFDGARFDAAYSVFLYHELPEVERERVIAESLRVLKPEGFFGLVDSIQTGDHPAYDPLLEHFPKLYHEPFFSNYISIPMEDVAKAAGVRDVSVGRGLYSKVVTGRKG